ncbi:hypothetical protein [Oribacterium sp. P6A1]|nr:hypothetical protein [Oribacterium sp. P6A1]
MAKEIERKCDTCRYCMSNYNGEYCGCADSSEYGLYSMTGV